MTIKHQAVCQLTYIYMLANELSLEEYVHMWSLYDTQLYLIADSMVLF